MIIPIASDHAGFKTKELVRKILEDMGHMPVDFGTHSEDSVDYPDFAIQVAERVHSGENDMGILVCGSGQGMCMTANKLQNIRAALVHDEDAAALTRRHNNANVLCLAGRELDEDRLEGIIRAWLDTDFEGGRHERRVNKINSLTKDS